MSSSQPIIFHCPNCQTQLSVPANLAGVTGPCPTCQAQISAPRPIAPQPIAHPQAVSPYAPPAAPPAYTPPQAPPAAAHSPIYGSPKESIRPEPRQSAQRPAPSARPAEPAIPTPTPAAVAKRTPTSPGNVITARRKPAKSNIFLRALIPVLILSVLGCGIFFLSRFLDGNSLTQSSDPRKEEIKRPTSIESELGEPDTIKQSPTTPPPSQTAIKVKAPLAPILSESPPPKPPVAEPSIGGINPIPSAPPPTTAANNGAIAKAMVEKFLSSSSLEQRIPYIFSKKPAAELKGTIFDQPWPKAEVIPGSQLPNSAERLIEYYYEVRFETNNLGFPEQAVILVHQRGNEEPKIIAEPLLDIIGPRLRDFTKIPTNIPQDFFVIMDARSRCFDDTVPNAAKKSTFYLRAHNSGSDIATAYANEQSDTRKLFDDPIDGLKWKNPIPVVVTLQWNTAEDSNRPFLEIIEIKAKNWNP